MILYVLALLWPYYAKCLPLAVLKPVGGMCYPIFDVIGLKSHHGTNYK